MSHIYYREDYKYQLAKNYSLNIGITDFRCNRNPFVQLIPEGILSMKSGYAWDGASGPVKDCKENMRSSLVHDALYQLLREGALPQELRDQCDAVFRKISIEDGISSFRAWGWYYGLKFLGHGNASPKSRKVEQVAPERTDG